MAIRRLYVAFEDYESNIFRNLNIFYRLHLENINPGMKSLSDRDRDIVLGEVDRYFKHYNISVNDLPDYIKDFYNTAITRFFNGELEPDDFLCELIDIVNEYSAETKREDKRIRYWVSPD